ncbi:hypothetical protein D9758_000466 [Tetrapyrgos nigripes]|uniref:LYR motif-containing protein Cup1-like N-terminal domain-containing protein n=1 Tax=Tetrapyrgos nigripes TaxID=182062 RepID=A0A8H5LZ38_9AGAR|nr:hypothetical protein D9758_000466 [Tetrapyrgos nigripes]
MQTSITSLYRSYLRQIRRLPHHYLRSFFRIKASDDFRSIVGTSNQHVQRVKVKRVSKDVRKIERALNGNAAAFSSILDSAYGRRGKLRWEIMKPILSDPTSPLPEPLIPSKAKSRPPLYTKELQALLTSSIARSTATPVKQEYLKFPPDLSPRADPTSEEARLLGPLSKRLEINKRWRFYTKEWRKVLPPAGVFVKSPDGTVTSDLSQVGIRSVGLQDDVFKGIEEIVGPLETPRPITRRERRLASDRTHRHPSRWLRRRYQELLGRLPTLVYSHDPNRPEKQGNYAVYLSTNALHPDLYNSAIRRPLLDDCNLAWVKQADDLQDKERRNG